MKAYYAHSIAIYGSKQEKRDIHLIERLGMDVLNPNLPKHEKAYQDHIKVGLDGMSYFLDLVDKCDLVIFRANPDGSIPAGVMKEISYAEEQCLTVLEIPSGVSRRELSVQETREWLREGGCR